MIRILSLKKTTSTKQTTFFAIMLSLMLTSFLSIAGELCNVPITEKLKLHLTSFLSPIIYTKNIIINSIDEIQEAVQSQRQLRAEKDRLIGENEDLKDWKTKAQAYEHENKVLRSLLGCKPQDGHITRAGQVLHRALDSSSQYLLVNMGKSEGVTENQVAFTEQGLVGRVISVDNHAAHVLILTDVKSRIPVVLEKKREHGILAGNNSDSLDLIYVSNMKDVEVGEKVITSGEGDIFPAGIVVGVVEEIGENIIKVKPIVDWNKIEVVRLIEVPEKTAYRYEHTLHKK